MNMLSKTQIENIWEKRGIILANNAFWVRDVMFEWFLVCPNEVVITTSGSLTEDDQNVDEIPEPPME